MTFVIAIDVKSVVILVSNSSYTVNLFEHFVSGRILGDSNWSYLWHNQNGYRFCVSCARLWRTGNTTWGFIERSLHVFWSANDIHYVVFHYHHQSPDDAQDRGRSMSLIILYACTY